MPDPKPHPYRPTDIAIIGMAGRFPGASDLEGLWRNLCSGVESITRFGKEELLAAGVDEALLSNPDYVRARSVLPGVERFDAEFFGFSPREAEILDPQQRHLLEVCWKALEDAGYDPMGLTCPAGVFAGSGTNTYLLYHLLGHREILESQGAYQVMLLSDPDFLATRTSYKLNLKGPGLTVQTACSTSLTAVHLAVQSLLCGECDMALAGGVRIAVPQQSGYLYQAGGVQSPDGRCRPFDALAAGSVDGNGVGVVVLKRLSEAMADGDSIRALIRGTALNNDGASKVGYTAPSVEGQAAVVATAQALAQVEPESISYLEAHGTGTPMGDPIEVEALRRAFDTDQKGFCALGSIKSNLGHMDAAAGVAGLIKATLALQHRQLPPTLHYQSPNPALRLEESPFFVNSRLQDWDHGARPRRAGVSSFGIGGTNAHVVVEEAPRPPEPGPSRSGQLLIMSARSAAALEETQRNLLRHLEEHPEQDLADVAYTMQVGRHAFAQRRMLVCSSRQDALKALQSLDPLRVLSRTQLSAPPPVFFAFPGQGAQYSGMMADLYRQEAAFREEVDTCAELLKPRLGLDLRQAIFGGSADGSKADANTIPQLDLTQTSLAQPALFVTEYALARMWMSWGIQPAGLIGHSVGEFVAACLAGSLSLPDALQLVALRGELMQSLPQGAMLAVEMGEEELQPLLSDSCSLAAINGPRLCVASGPPAEMKRLASRLSERGVEHRQLHTSHAFHSPMMDPIAEPFSQAVSKAAWHSPRLKWISSSTGAWISPQEAASPDYWVGQMRRPVRFSQGLEHLFQEQGAVLLEVGPGNSLTSLARRHPSAHLASLLLASGRHPRSKADERSVLLKALGQLWLTGLEIDWAGFQAGFRRRRVPLPSYPFQGRRYWLESRPEALSAKRAEGSEGKLKDLGQWFWVPSWKQSALPSSQAEHDPGLWLVFVDRSQAAERLAAELTRRGAQAVRISPGSGYRRLEEGAFQIRPDRAEDFARLLDELPERPAGAAYLWSLSLEGQPLPLQQALQSCFHGPLLLAQALGKAFAEDSSEPIRLLILTNGLQRIGAQPWMCPEKALALGPCLVIPQEIPALSCRTIDVSLPRPGSWQEDRFALCWAQEILSSSHEPVVAYRGADRWVRSFERHPLPQAPQPLAGLRSKGVYLISGGLGGIGFELAKLLAGQAQARLVLVGRGAGSETHSGRIKELEELGAEVLVISADVSQASQVREMLDQAKSRFGTVDGLIHAAGLAGGGSVQLYDRDQAELVLAPKLQGTVNLASALEGEELDFMLLCSSLASVLGGPGQAAYSSANAFLDAFAQDQAARLGRRAVSLGWDAWQQVGMAARAAQSLQGLAASQAHSLGHPLLESFQAENGRRTFFASLAPSRHWILSEHRLGGQPVVPGTAYLEMARAAFESLDGPSAVELKDVLFQGPLQVPDDHSQEVQTVLEKQGEEWRFSIRSRSGNGASQPWRPHAAGTIRRLDSPAPAATDLNELTAGVPAQSLGEEYRESLRTAGLGPRWEVLKKVYPGQGQLLGILSLGKEFSSDLEQLKLHPSLLDAATGFAEAFLDLEDGYYLPLSYQRLRLHSPLQPQIYSLVRWRDDQPRRQTVSYDLQLLDSQGAILAEIDGFTLMRVSDVSETVRTQTLQEQAGNGEQQPAFPRPSADGARNDLSQAILPQEGVEILARILGAQSPPHVLVSTRGLEAEFRSTRELVRSLRRPARSDESADFSHQRPELETPYLAPRNPFEVRVAKIWQEVLGVEQVGVHDEFFELGGHSLLATQVVSRIRDAFQVELPLEALFEATTVAGFAELISQSETVQDEAIPAAQRPSRIPLSFAQQRIWFLDRLDPGNPIYNISQAFRLRGGLQVEALQAAICAIVDRHEILRTSIAEIDQQPCQVIAPTLDLPLPLVDLSALPQPLRKAQAERAATCLSALSFSLQQGPLLGVALLRHAPAEHVFVLTLHHIVGDGWSVAVFVQELASLYQSFVQGSQASLAELPVQYADFTLWQRRRLEEDQLASQLDYWSRKLAGELPPLQLPTDRPRPPLQSFRGASLSTRLPDDLTQRLKELAAAEKATLFMALLSAFKLLLGRLSGQGGLIIGSPVAGRSRAEVEGLIGMFLNTLALRTDLSGSPTFRQLAGRVRQTVLDAFAHQEVPFESILERLQPERDLSRTPVFQALFNMQDFPRRQIDLAGLSMESLPLQEAPAKFDLTVYAAEVDEEIHLELVYSTGLFDEARMVELLGQYRCLLEQVVEQPDKPIEAYSLLTEAARSLLPDPGANLESHWEGAAHEVFSRQAERVAERLALSDAHGCWSYAALEARSNRLAHRLIEADLGAHPVVAVYAARAASLAWALLGVLKAGGAFVILDPAYPALRLREVLRQARPQCFLSLQEAGPLPGEAEQALAELGCCRFVLGPDSVSRREGPPAAPQVQTGPDDTAYIAFTSGSTGVPKGIQGRHGPLAHCVAWHGHELGAGPQDRWSMLSALSHDPLLRDIFVPLQLGGTICIPPPADLLNPGQLAGWMRREQVTIANLTPGLGRLLTDGEVAPIPSLRQALFVGEALTGPVVSRWRELAPRAACINLYGSTETQQSLGFCRVPELIEEGAAARIPLGKGMPGVQLLVLNPAGQLAGVGELGEIALRSPHLAQGYLDDPEATRQRFAPNPWSDQPGDRIYRSGDLGRYRPDGLVTYVGRSDDQVQIRGFRVEPGEVEAVLSRYPGLGRCAVAANLDHSGQACLTAFVTWEKGAGERNAPPEGRGAEGLRRFMLQWLPGYMVPSAFIELKELPLTSSKKVDRAALAKFEARRPEQEGSAQPTPIEELLAGIWSELLGLQGVERNDDFFERGGHSLLATRMASRIQGAFGVQMPVRMIFEEPRLGQLARRISQLRGASEGAALPPLAPRPAGEAPDLSFAQQRLWFLDQLQPGSPLYTISAALRLEGRLDIAALQSALTEIVRRHESLRTAFPAHDGNPVQVIRPPAPVPLPWMDLTALPSGPADEELRGLAARQALAPFDLAQGPLIRANLLLLEREEHPASCLLLTMHHIVSDGWSMRVLADELCALYGAFAAGRPSPLRELPVQYADFACWQRAWLKGAALEQQLGYWKSQLQGVDALQLPLDRPRPARPSYRGAQQGFTWPAGLVDSLKSLSRQRGATLFMTLLTALQSLLCRYSGQTDFCVGTAIANRNQAETEGLIGFFVNTLVMRADLAGQPSLEEALGRTRETALDAYAHQDVPFEKVVEALRPDRLLNRTPLFQVMFALQNVPQAALQAEGLKLLPMSARADLCKFDLSLLVAEPEEGGLEGMLEFSLDIFEPVTIQRWIGQLGSLLEEFAARPDQPAATVALTSPAERHQMLWEWNDTSRQYPGQASVGELFEALLPKCRDSVAAVCESGQISYQELQDRSFSLAAFLRLQGVGPESLAGLFAERSLETLVGMLGILHCGAAYLPLDPSYPPGRIAFMLSDSQAAIILTQQGLLGRLPSQDSPLVCLDRDWGQIARHSQEGAKAAPKVQAENLAYVIYTSGSQGRPKGVAVTHRGVARLVYGNDRVWLGEGEAVLLFSPLSFDASTHRIWGCLLRGGRLILPRPGPLALEQLETTIRDLQVSFLGLTAPLFRLLADQSPQILAQPIQILSGGAEMPLAQTRRALRSGTARLINAYGPTENTCHTCYHIMQRPQEAEQGASIPLGRPLANSTVYLLDRHLKPAPRGAAAELCAGGDGLARGYFRRPGLTAASFVPHPFLSGQRLYRTGDLARWRADGAVEFLGRLDDQLKLRGFRIEPGEIEAALRRHPAVDDAVVMLRRDRAGNPRLAAYLTNGPHSSPSSAELVRFLSDQLPEYMLPSAFLHLERLPLTPSGKLDRRALPQRVDFGGQASYEPPRSGTEEILAGIWSELLGVEKAGIQDNFFELGGHSLLATQAISRIRQAFQVELPLRAVFEAPSLAELALRIDEARTPGGAAPGPPLLAGPRPEELPLSFAQQRLWFLNQLEPGNPFYNVPVAIRLRGQLRVSALEWALNQVVSRHEALRTCFPDVDGRPAQQVVPQLRVGLGLLELSALPAYAQGRELGRLQAEEAQRPFDLATGPLIRANLVRLANQEHALLASMHHIVSDDWSADVLQHELYLLYEAALKARLAPLPTLPVQYADFALWQRRRLSGEMLQEQLSYWKSRLSGAPSLELPTDRPRPEIPNYRGATLSFQVPGRVADSLRSLARSREATLFMALMSAFQLLMSRCSGQTDISVGTPIANRNPHQTEGLIGFFLNTLVFRLRLQESGSFIELVEQLREVALGAYSHQDVPFEQLVDALQTERTLSRAPLFQVMFTLKSAAKEIAGFSALQATALPDKISTSRFDLTVIMREGPAGLQGLAEYSSDLFDRSSVQRLLRSFLHLLQGLAADPRRPLCRIPLLDAAGRQQLLREWNDTAAPRLRQRAVHERVAAQSKRTPDSLAVVHRKAHLSLAELNRRAESLANRMRREGAGADLQAAIFLERSPEMVLAVLAVLKAGAACLPVDPSYPEKRISRLLTDSSALLVLSRQGLLGRLPQSRPAVVCLDELQDGSSRPTADHPASLENLAYVIYTSGSTGQPKGVGLTHRTLANLIAWQLQSASSPGCRRTVQFASLSFDVSFQEIFSAWCSGSPLILASQEQRQDPEALLGLLVDERAEALFLPFVALQQLALATPASAPGLCLRDVFSAGEQLQITLQVEQWLRQLPGCRLHNHYGPSETHVVTAWTCPRMGGGLPALAPIGRPISNCSICLLDARQQPVALGVSGELCIGGAALARGYLGHSRQTAEKFVPDPFAAHPGSRLYRSGDLARFKPDGSIDFLGRSDHQVKIRGYRVELGEVEAVLSRHLQVRESAAALWKTPQGTARLVAYFVRRPGQGSVPPPALAAEELRRFLQARLPGYMVPSALVELEQLPLTPSGKLDRRSLPQLEQTSPPEASQTLRTAYEEVLAGIWSEVLGTRPVGGQDHFFEAGGHSLLATQVVSRVRKAFGIELPVRAIFEYPLLADLARRIEEGRWEGSALPPLQRQSGSGPLPLSPAQQRLWFLDQIEPFSAVYNLSAALRLKGSLHLPALEASLNEIVRRHQVLRTRFPARNGKPSQLVSQSAWMRLHLADLSACPAEQAQAELQGLASKQAARPFDLARGPLLTLLLVRLGEDKHALLATMHHIVADGWSFGILTAELTALYGAFGQLSPSPLPELAVQYADYACWQRSWLQGEAQKRQIDYWKKQLSGVPALELACDHPRSSRPSQQGARQSFGCPAELTERLRRLSRSRHATLYMTLLAAFQALLSRYSGQADIAVGSPIANRNQAEAEKLIGFFVNTLVMRADLSGNPSFLQLLDRVRETALDAYAHQDVPFEQVVEALEPERVLNRTPLFQVIFALENTPRQPLDLPGLQIERLGVDSSLSKFDLTVTLSEVEGGLEGVAQYSTGLFEAASIQRLLEHFLNLLQVAAEQPEECIELLPLLSREEQGQLLAEWNPPGHVQRKGEDPSVAEEFERTCRISLHSVAVVYDRSYLSYAGLNHRSARLAGLLLERGAEPDSPVGILARRGLEMVAAMLAALRAGAAYLPLDPEYPGERLSWMLRDAGARLLLAQGDLLGRLAEIAGQAIPLDGEVQPGEPAALCCSFPHPDQLAYVIYTSGSTGTPKGVAVTHRAIIRLVKEADYVQLQPGERVAQVANSSFDAITFEMWGALLNGGCVAGAQRETLLSPQGFADWLRDEQIAAMFLTSSLFNQVAASQPKAFCCLRHLLIGGEALDPRWVRHVLEQGPPERLLNGYGPTEATTFAVWKLVEMVAPGAMTVPIGGPLSGMSIYLLDRHANPVAEGVPGELCLGGDGLARGYVNRPALTAERFVVHPFDQGERLYRTGDRVRWRQGAVEFLGRFDDQVKIRGFRIEPGEVETVLSGHSGLRQCAVLVREGDGGQRRLVAYAVPEDAEAARSGSAASRQFAQQLRRYLEQRLPGFLVPSAFALLEELPLTPNGKLDRSGLPDPEELSHPADTAPLTPSEELLAGIWSEVLGIKDVNRQDNFFHLGGHSLLATQVVSRIRSDFGIDLKLRTIFEAPTLHGLGQRVEEALRSGAPSSAPPLKRTERQGELLLSFAQQRLWFLDQLVPGSPLYNIPVALRLKGPLQQGVLQACLDCIVQRHETLRTIFPARDGRPVQLILRRLPIPVPCLSLTRLAPSWREAELQRLLRREALGAFSLESGPLLRVRLLRLDKDEHVLAVNMHHIVSDGWSMGVLVREFTVLYEAFSERRPSPLPELPLQYADFASWQNRWLSGEVLHEQVSYWKERLKGVAHLEIPTDRPRSGNSLDFRGAVRSFGWPESLSEGVRNLAQSRGATLFMTLLAAFQALLQRYSGQQDISVGTPVANRNRAETEGLIGFFVNTLVLRSAVSPRLSFADLLTRVRETALGAYAYQDVPFEQVVEAVQPERSLSRTPLFQVMFAFQNTPQEQICLPGLQVEPLGQESVTAKFDLSLSISDGEGALQGAMDFRLDLFDLASIGRMLGHLRNLLEQAVANPEQPLGELSLMSAAELQQVGLEWNDSQADSDWPQSLPGLFAKQAPQIPWAIACTWGSQQLSYSELERQASQLASGLEDLGADAETVVGLALGPSIDLVTAMLAIGMAGGCCLPLDPAYPADRLSSMIQDSQALLLLTDRLSDQQLSGQSVRCLRLGDLRNSFSSQRCCKTEPLPDQLAYLIFTSGSTGRPKGVAVSHRSACNHLQWMQHHYSLSPSDRVLQRTVISFDASVWEFWAPLAMGARIDLIRSGEHGDVHALIRTMVRKSITIIQLVPSMLSTLLDEGLSACRTLRRIMCGGEELTRGLAERAREEHPAQLVNLYGPSECCIDATHWVVERQSDRHSIPIGRPIRNAQALVLDRSLQPLPIGVAGELHIGGCGLARGYIGRPAKTADRFIPHPLAARPGQRLYKTGDRSRWLPDGILEFLGRLDFQVKVRGHRIELGEIEAALSLHPALRKAAAAVLDRSSGAQLAAFAVSDWDPPPTASELQGFLMEQLPHYMVPPSIVLLDELPLTASGKLDRKALSQTAAVEQRPQYEKPATPTEAALAGIWSDLLQREQIGREDRFFELGGHSLLATQVVSRIRQQLQAEIALAEVFEAPTLKGLAARIDAAGGRPISGRAMIPKVPRQGPLPLSPAQLRLWLHDQTNPGSSFYNMFTHFEMLGSLRHEAFRHTLSEIVHRHEVLRTTYGESEGQPVQRVGPPRPQELPIIDLSAVQAPLCDRLARQLAVQEARCPFDLANGPVLRTTLVRLSPERHWLIFIIHHIACDGWSMDILMSEAGPLYDAFASGKPSPLPDLPLQYADFAAWHAGAASSPPIKRRLLYWRKRLDRLPEPLEVVADFPRPAIQTGRGSSLSEPLSEELSKALGQMAADNDVTLFMTGLAVFQTLLSCYSGCSDVVTGTNLSGRDQLETETMIGFFVNQAVLRTDLSGNPTFREVLASVRQTVLEAHQNEVPFDALVEDLNPRRDPGYSLLFQHKFEFMESPAARSSFQSLQVRSLGAQDQLSRYDLHLTLLRSEKQLSLVLMYCSDLYEAATAKRISADFQSLARAVAHEPSRRLDDLVRELKVAQAQHQEQEEMEYRSLLQGFKQIRRKS